MGDSFEHANISPFIYLYGDTSLQQEIEFILENSHSLDFELNGKKSINKGVTDAVWWIKFPLKNKTFKEKKLLLEIADPDLHDCQLFIVRKNGLEKSTLTGDFYPFDQRPIKHRYFLFPISLASDEEVVCYFKADKNSQTLIFHTQLWDQESFIENNSEVSLINGIFIGSVIVFLSIISFLVFLFYSKTFLYYFFYIFSLLIFYLNREGFVYQFLWPTDYPQIYALIRAIWPIFQLVFLVLIGGEFLERLSLSRIEIRIYKWAKRIVLALLPISAFLYYLSKDTPFARAMTILFVSLGLLLFSTTLGILFFITIKEYLSKKKFEPLGISFVILAQISIVLILVSDLFFKTNRSPDFVSQLYVSVFLFELIIVSTILYTKYWKTSMEKEHLALVNSQQKLGFANVLLKGQEKERIRIAKNLQKDLQPLLNQANLIFQKNYKNDGNSVLSQNIIEHLNQSKHEVNRIVNNLIPEFLFEKDLLVTIQMLCTKIEDASEFDVLFNYKNITHTFSDNQKINIYRIIQELLNNVIKHAQATQVQIDIKQTPDQLIILVEDNGVGVKDELQGFNTLKARTKTMDGNIVFTNAEKSGLKVEIKIPLHFKYDSDN